MKDLIEFKTVIPANTYKAYLKEYECYDLYCGPLLIAVNIDIFNIYELMRLLKGNVVC